jgi:hypothetical protein
MVLHHQDYHLRGCVTQTQPKTNARWASVVDPKAENGCLKRSGAGPFALIKRRARTHQRGDAIERADAKSQFE